MLAVSMDLLQNYDSPVEICKLLQAQGLATKKRFGQNFLICPGARKKIISALKMQPDDYVWEIGPGLGALTHHIIDSCARLVLFEIDHGFIRYLVQAFKHKRGVKIVAGDVLKTWPHLLTHKYNSNNAADGGRFFEVLQIPRPAPGPDEITLSEVPDIITGNLPYCSAAAIIGSFAEYSVVPRTMVFTIQREVAERMAAKPGTKNYSSFTLACALHWETHSLGDLQAGAFFPRPEVVSRIVKMIPHHKYDHVPNSLYFALVKQLFSSRRKNIHNTLLKKPLVIKAPRQVISPQLCRAAIEKMGLNGSMRGETLRPEQVAELAVLISEI